MSNPHSVVRASLRLLALTSCLIGRSALAEPLLPAPSGEGVDQQLAGRAQGFQRQQDVFATAENGLSLDIDINATDVGLVKSFFAQTASDDFQQVTGRHPFSVVQTFGEWGDEGNFAGVASVGVAARLMVLRRDGAAADEIARARASAIRAARAWHVFGSIGGPGVVARGIERLRPENPKDPPLPGTPPATVALSDGAGHALPATKDNTWRAPVAPGFEDWIWLDDTSKDQVVGYALAVAWLSDALAGDAAVPAQVTQDLSNDLAAFAHALKQVAPETGVDLCIRDADGRLTAFHDLNPRELVPGLVVGADETAQNGFNATLALAIVRAAYHVSGDEELGRWYYEDLVAKRNLPALTGLNPGLIFTGESTNFSNVNMLAIAYATLARVETDPAVRAQLQDSIEHAFWNTGSSRDVSHVKQAWFDAVYASFSPAADPNAIVERIHEDLGGFQPAPAFERDRLNCTQQAAASGTCTAVDGKTIIHPSANGNHGGSLVATEIVPMSVRPDSDFEWRSDPFRINGTGGTNIDPRGDYLAAYWMARLVDRDPAKNVSANARTWPPPQPSAKPAANGCRCEGASTDVLALLVLAAWARAKRVRRQG
jgi:hypothetical protein